MTAKTFVPALIVVGIVSFLLGQRWPVRPLGTESPGLVLTTTQALPRVGLPGAQASGLLEKEREEPPKPPPGKIMETVGPAENVASPLSAALKAKLESSFQNREKEKMVVLQNDQTDNGQTITLMIKRPNRGEVRNMLLGAIRDLGVDSSTSSVEDVEKKSAKQRTRRLHAILSVRPLKSDLEQRFCSEIPGRVDHVQRRFIRAGREIRRYHGGT